jgi:superfamily II DNA or RNA helicase
MGSVTTRDWVAWGARQRVRAIGTPRASAPAALGELELADFQRRAVDRLVQIARTYRGALLADVVGMGKTRVALAAGALLSAGGPITVCAPARVVPTWRRALASAGVDAGVVTHTSMSRADAGPSPGGVLIVDEAHRFRNPAAARSRTLAAWCAGATVLLVTATPVCSGAADLYNLLRLFLAEDDLRPVVGANLHGAFARGGAPLQRALQEVVVRRERAPSGRGFGRRPAVSMEVLSYEPDATERWLWRHLGDHAARLSLAVWDGAWPSQLFVEYLLRRWESGPRALSVALDALIAFHERWLRAAERGVELDARSYRVVYQGAGDQGVLGFMLPARPLDTSSGRQEAARNDLATLRALARFAAASNDGARVVAIAREIARHPEDTRWLIFASAPDAAREVYDGLRAELGASVTVGLITGQEAVCTGLGAVGSEEILARFSPRSQGLAPLEHHESVRLLVCTDCVSLGVDLQDCGRVVLADLPYTPLGVEQRVGRLLRPGGPHAVVRVYLPRPADWQDSLGLRRRLDDRLTGARDLGAPFVAASVLERGDASARPASPLDLLDALDALSDAVGPQPTGDDLGGWWRAPGGPPGLWVCFRVEHGARARAGWLRVDPDGRVDDAPAALLPALMRLADARHELTRGEPDPGLLAAARAHLDAELALRHASALAPSRAGEGAGALWEVLVASDLPIAALDAARALVLRAHPRGVDAALGAIARARLSGDARVARARRVVRASAPVEAPRLAWMCGVMLTG